MNIFVGNLSRDVTEEELRTAFSAFGQVSGFVEMPAKAEAQAAINGMNQKDLKGRALNVNEARPKTERPGGGGGGGGGRGGWGNRGGGGGGGNRGGGGGGGRRW